MTVFVSCKIISVFFFYFFCFFYKIFQIRLLYVSTIYSNTSDFGFVFTKSIKCDWFRLLTKSFKCDRCLFYKNTFKYNCFFFLQNFQICHLFVFYKIFQIPVFIFIFFTKSFKSDWFLFLKKCSNTTVGYPKNHLQSMCSTFTSECRLFEKKCYHLLLR